MDTIKICKRLTVTKAGAKAMGRKAFIDAYQSEFAMSFAKLGYKNAGDFYDKMIESPKKADKVDLKK